MSLAGYFFTVVFVLIFHFLFTYTILIKLFTALNPVKFFQNLRDVVVFTFSTSSSSASIPFTLKAAEEKYGIDKSVSTFTVPLGATINMDGTALCKDALLSF